MIKIAVIGGTGVYDPTMLTNLYQMKVDTPYGEVGFQVGSCEGREVAFLPRHGNNHSIPPHLINYRANIWALKRVGVETIIATTAVGSLNANMKPGDLVVVDQFLDFSKQRISSFFQGGEQGVVHLDVTVPYCPQISNILVHTAQELKVPVHADGTYICTEGPRFETPAEIRMFAKWGGDLVGMTNVPEVLLAREAEMCYATISMVTNFAAGISPTLLTHQEVLDIMKENAERIRNVIMHTLPKLDVDADCVCKHALQEYGGFCLHKD